ncbi:uncharacterized protein LOC125225493 [Leguminivora glycinivorella]|uniref:uncharacterized protein LOC125225493 n=1 Tax=Leguminivora glycinivorella TaxID=1035111 RepID=UPI00200FEBEF|nr:uncharacterized protein LOC125225493 [Leguminivora glycinivorella]
MWRTVVPVLLLIGVCWTDVQYGESPKPPTERIKRSPYEYYPDCPPEYRHHHHHPPFGRHHPLPHQDRTGHHPRRHRRHRRRRLDKMSTSKSNKRTKRTHSRVALVKDSRAVTLSVTLRAILDKL